LCYNWCEKCDFFSFVFTYLLSDIYKGFTEAVLEEWEKDDILPGKGLEEGALDEFVVGLSCVIVGVDAKVAGELG